MYKKSINEECGVFGTFNCDKASYNTFLALQMLQHRGQEACGVAVSEDGIECFKGNGLVANVFSQQILDGLVGTNAIGHVRYSTSGGGGLQNVQPFVFKSSNEEFALCHNGNIVNSLELREELEEKGAIFSSTSDTEIIAHLLKQNKGDFLTRLKLSLPRLVGSFAFLFLFEDCIIATLDSLGLRPLSIGRKGDTYYFSSESCVFDLLGAEFVCDLNPGEIVKISKSGLYRDNFTTETSKNMCSMEYIYFARPDSVISGTSVYQERERMGAKLAQNSKTKADLLVGVPDSGLAATTGYAKESGLLVAPAIVKNKYSGRSFIMPTDELRKQVIELKFSVIKELVNGKSVILIDDSIVRGHTSKKIVELIYKAGAREVHLKIASPKIIYPCFYGVDFSTKKELICHTMNEDEMTKYIGCDSIQFLEIEDLKDNTCKACFSGEYKTKLFSQQKKEIYGEKNG